MHSYGSIYNLGHKAVLNILDGDVIVEEKVDGSQFSFGVYDGQLVMRSKGSQVFAETKDKLFRPAVDTVIQLSEAGKLMEGWTYRGETLAKPKHNALAYERVPAGNIILFDIDRAQEDYLPPGDKQSEAARLGLETVPLVHVGRVESMGKLKELLTLTSVLGGVPIEGVVIKRYDMFTMDKHVAMAKFVSEAFKEVHRKEWKLTNPSQGDVIERLCEEMCTTARFQKAVQHLREAGQLEGSVRDIGKLISEIQRDVLEEEAEYVKDKLYAQFKQKIARGAVRGFAQWYKDALAEQTFAPAEDQTVNARACHLRYA